MELMLDDLGWADWIVIIISSAQPPSRKMTYSLNTGDSSCNHIHDHPTSMLRWIENLVKRPET
jgi:hypothetical protein